MESIWLTNIDLNSGKVMIIVRDKSAWNSIIEKEFSEYNDIYFRYEYIELFEKHYNVKLEGKLWEDNRVKIFWGHLIRDISEIEQFKDFKYYDLTTAYGYGGPLIIAKTEDNEKTKKSIGTFLAEYEDFAQKSGYICEFIRFHPFLGMGRYLKGNFVVEYVNDVIAVDLTQELEEIWRKISKGQRYNIKKSEKEGSKTEIIRAPKDKDIQTFLDIYYQAMDRRKATVQYYFTKEFVKDSFNTLNSILIMIKHRDEIIGTSMFIFGEKIIHYHLSGATLDLKGVYPSALALWGAIKWAKEIGFDLLHLGGGRGKSDSLFKFKRSFFKKHTHFILGSLIQQSINNY